MNLEQRIEKLERALEDNQESLKKYERVSKKNKDDKSLDLTIKMLKTTIYKIRGELSILKKMEDLENKYQNREPLSFHFVDFDMADDRLLPAGDINYNNAYLQQRQLLELELNHFNKQAIKGIDFDSSNYENVYDQAKNDILSMKIDTNFKNNEMVNENINEKEEAQGLHFKKDDLGNNVKSDMEVNGSHFKKVQAVSDNDYNPYVGGRHFKPNQSDYTFIEFEKDGYGYIVGNFTSDFLNNNYEQLNISLLNDDLKGVKLINNVSFGLNDIEGLDGVQINVTRDGDIQVIGNVENLKYHNVDNKKSEEQSKEDKDISELETISDEEVSNEKDDSGLDILPADFVPVSDDEVLNEKDDSGLDILPADFMPVSDGNVNESINDKVPNINEDSNDKSLSNGAVPMNEVPVGPIKRKEAKPSLIEKFKNLKTYQKVLIVAGAIAIVGAGVFVVGPQILNGINHLLNPDNTNTINHVVSTVNDTMANTQNAGIDYSSLGQGQTVFTNAYDAANNVNGVISNEWFSNNPLDVFNTATHSYMGLSPEQLNDPSFMAQLAKDPNNAVLFGNSMADPSGFVGLDDVVNTVTKVR